MPSFFFHIAIDLAASSPSLNNFPRSGIFDRVVPKHKTSNLRAAAKDFVARPPAEQTRPSPSTNPEAVSHGIKNQIQDIAPEPRSQNPPSPISPASHTDDWRVGRIALQVIDMLSTASGERLQKGGTADVHISNGIGAGPGGLATKGRFEPSDVEEEDIGWGVVRLYRDSEETPGLYDDVPPVKSLKHGKHSRLGQLDQDPPFRNEDCTTLCILAVPSYLTPSDFLGFVGDETRDEVSHFRMIRTERVNRYMVLMKFRNGRKAREWRKEWNGKAFNPMEVRHHTKRSTDLMLTLPSSLNTAM
jgi:BRCA1-associated protein